MLYDWPATDHVPEARRAELMAEVFGDGWEHTVFDEIRKELASRITAIDPRLSMAYLGAEGYCLYHEQGDYLSMRGGLCLGDVLTTWAILTGRVERAGQAESSFDVHFAGTLTAPRRS